MGKRKLNESDSDDSDEDGDEGETEKSVLLNSQNESGSNKAEDSFGSVTGKKRDGDSSGVGSCESGSEGEKETVLEGNVESVGSKGGEILDAKLSVAAEPMVNDEMMEAEADAVPYTEALVSGVNAQDNGDQDCSGALADKFDGSVTQAPNIVSSETVANDMEIDGSLEHKAAVIEESLPSTSVPTLEEPLNFDVFNSAAELEVYF